MGFQLNNLSGTGTIPVNYFNLTTTGKSFVQNGAMQCTISQYGAINEFILGGLTGTVRDSVAQANYPMTGSFKVKRTN
jgi:hypothetical protein